MNIYKVVVPGTKIDMEISAHKMEKNSAGSIIFYNIDKGGKQTTIGAFPRETVAYKIDQSPWKLKIDKISSFIENVNESIRSVDPSDTPNRIAMREQVKKDFDIYITPIIEIILGDSYDAKPTESEELNSQLS